VDIQGIVPAASSREANER